jgi:hypothetical protein
MIKDAIVAYLREQGVTQTPEQVEQAIGIPKERILTEVMVLIQSGDKTICDRCGVLGLREWNK